MVQLSVFDNWLTVGKVFSLFLCLKIVVKATTFKAQLLCPKKAVTPFKKLYKQTLKSTSWKSILVEFLKTHCFQMDLTKVYSGPYFIMCLDKEGLPSLLIACLGLKRTVHMWWLNLLYGKCYAILASVWFFEKYQKWDKHRSSLFNFRSAFGIFCFPVFFYMYMMFAATGSQAENSGAPHK